MLHLACLSLCVYVCWCGCLLVGVYVSASGVVCRDVAGWVFKFGQFFETLKNDC